VSLALADCDIRHCQKLHFATDPARCSVFVTTDAFYLIGLEMGLHFTAKFGSLELYFSGPRILLWKQATCSTIPGARP